MGRVSPYQCLLQLWKQLQGSNIDPADPSHFDPADDDPADDDPADDDLADPDPGDDDSAHAYCDCGFHSVEAIARF